MQNAMTLMVLVAALFFSITCALLVEEFLCGRLFWLLARQAAKPRPQPKQKSWNGM